jgi:tetratricopeptide (TPR) repeat protein
LLAGCATAPPPSLASAAPPADSGPRGESSVFGLFLAGEAAIDRGSSKEGAYYFARASALDPASAALRSRAFTASLVAGDVHDAAGIGAGFADATDAVGALARLTRAVDAMAEGRDGEAFGLLSGPPFGSAHAAAAALIRPWAALGAGRGVGPDPSATALGNPVLASVAVLGRAERLESLGRFADAEALYKAHAGDRNGLFVLGYGAFLERRGRRADALQVYAKALASRPDDVAFAKAKERALRKEPPPTTPGVRQGAAEALLGPAVLMLAQHQGDSGLAYLRLALRLDPGLDEAWVLVGDAMSNAGDEDAAKAAYGRIKAGSPQFAAARSDLALALQRAGDKEGALTLVRETLKAEPDNLSLMSLYADLLTDDDRFDEAVGVLTKAIAAVGEAKAGWNLYFMRGAAEERSGRWDAAEADLKRALALNPSEPQVMNYLGYAWVDRGLHLPEALALLEKAEAKEPDSGAIVDSLGWARFRTHDYPSAIIDLERAVQLDPGDAEVNGHLGDVYWAVGRRLEAQYQWRRVLTLNPPEALRRHVEERLRVALATPKTEALVRTDGIAGAARP